MHFIGLFLAAALAQSAVPTGVHPPEVERQLAFLVDDWTIEGMEATYRETCRWYHQRSFVVCETTDSSEGAPSHSVSILGWSAATRNYTYHHYGQSGRSRSETCFANDQRGLTCLGERRTDDGLLQTRSHIWPVEGGAAFRSERSLNGGPWTETVSLKYVPRRN
ncbi:MAG TPA: hypothetical protein VFO69_04115 [Allosphingosinicella sp.]|nr:hypothetical protein [Allosphingosinicella sp.]